MEAPFPLNAWYVAAWSYQVGKREPLGRTVCNRRIVFWRKSDNSIAALEDACWHRLLPLSMGWLEGDDVVCRYHGLAFGGNGQCVRMPSRDKLNPAARVRSYPVVDRYRFVWVWPGDPALARSRSHSGHALERGSRMGGRRQTMFAKCDYRLLVDNLMDLTHESFVHATSIGNKHVAEVPMTTTHSGRTVTSTRWMLDIDAPPFWRAQIG